MQNTRCLKRLNCGDACDKPSFHKPREAPAGGNFGRTTARSTQPLTAIDDRYSGKSDWHTGR
jgi:hypothetical protein